MYAFAINIVDSSIDNKICKKQETSGGSEGKCKGKTQGDDKKLSLAFPSDASTEKVDVVTSKTIATETAALTR